MRAQIKRIVIFFLLLFSCADKKAILSVQTMYKWLEDIEMELELVLSYNQIAEIFFIAVVIHFSAQLIFILRIHSSGVLSVSQKVISRKI